MPTQRSVIAVIDDDVRIRFAMSRLLVALGYRTELYTSTKEFMEARTTTAAIGLIVDVQVGENCQITLTQDLAHAGFHIPVIFMSVDSRESLRRQAAGLDRFTLLTKPVSVYALMDALQELQPHPGRAGI
jgi:FixJ family two-component response regulator